MSRTLHSEHGNTHLALEKSSPGGAHERVELGVDVTRHQLSPEVDTSGVVALLAVTLRLMWRQRVW